MGRAPCCAKVGLHRGPWTSREDTLLTKYIEAHGEGNWRSLPKKAGLLRCGKSCRLRWMNYLRPDIKRGNITQDEDDLIIRMHLLLGNRWSLIAGRLPGRTDNEIKNYWNTHLSKKLIKEGTNPICPKENKTKKKKQNPKGKKKKKKNIDEQSSLVAEKPKVHLPKPTRITSFVNLPRLDSFNTSSTVVSSSQDQALDHVMNNDTIPWSHNFEEGSNNNNDVIFSVGGDHSLENIYSECLEALMKTTDQDHNCQLELDSFAESLLN